MVHLASYLKKMAMVGDVRVFNKKHFLFRTIVESKSPQEAFDRILAEKSTEDG